MNARVKRRIAVLIASAALASGAQAATVDVAGVAHQEAIVLDGSTLQLNGAGVRYKAVFKVYTAALYLGTRASTPEDALAAAGAKRVVITMLRDIDANELGKLFTRGVEDNSPRGEFSQLIPGLLRMGRMFADQKQLKSGDTVTLDWLPGVGTVTTVKGVRQPDPIREVAFFNALLRIWLGPVPADYRLKDALLGKG